MEMNDFVASCLFMDGQVFDKFCEAFDVDMSEEDVHETLELCHSIKDYHAFGPLILECMFKKVISDYKHILDKDKFDYDFSSPSFPDFYYDEERISCREDLDEIANRK